MDLGELPKVECYAGKLNQVFMNILTNAVQAPRRSHRWPDVVRSKVLDGDSVEIRFRDNGPGMPTMSVRAFSSRSTRPRRSVKDRPRLSIAYNIVDKSIMGPFRWKAPWAWAPNSRSSCRWISRGSKRNVHEHQQPTDPGPVRGR